MVDVTGPFGQALSALGAGAGSLVLLVLLAASLRRWAEATQGPSRSAVGASVFAPAVSSQTPARGAEPTEAPEDGGSRLAAAVAVSLYLEGLAGAPTADVVAAMAVALSLAGGRPATPGAAGASSWKLAGRIAGLRGR